MTTTEAMTTCPICHTKDNCPCKQAMVSYFKLLSAAEGRVLRVEPTSLVAPLPLASAGIDKINAYFTNPVPNELIHAQARTARASAQRVFLKDKRAYLEIATPKGILHAPLNRDQTAVVGIVTNPNRFSDWDTYRSTLFSIFPGAALQSAQIHRLDLNLDFNCDLTDLIQSIDIKNKRQAISYNDSSGIRTGLNIGKGAEYIVIYDKAKKLNLPTPLSRIELRLSKNKLPTKTLQDLPEKIMSKSFFGSIVGIAIDDMKPALEEQKIKLHDFKMQCARDGYYSARKSFDANNNFSRDFSKLLKIQEWSKQPQELFKDEIKKFFIHQA